jgi:hypothetical protein
MNERCAGCEVEEKLKNLQVLRHIMVARQKNRGATEEETFGAHDDGTGKSMHFKEQQAENRAADKNIRRT